MHTQNFSPAFTSWAQSQSKPCANISNVRTPVSICLECENEFDDNNGETICKTCEDWFVEGKGE